MMSILFFLEALTYTVFTMLLSVKTVKVFVATITWRIMAIVSILGLVLSAYFQLSPQNSVLSSFHCFNALRWCHYCHHVVGKFYINKYILLLL